MHHDVTLNDVTANINQRYSNSLLSHSGVYLFQDFQARSMHADSWVWREVKKREGKKGGRYEKTTPYPTPRNFSYSHLFAPSPQSELTPAIG